MPPSNKIEVFLLEATPYNPALPGNVDVRFSTGAPNNSFNGNKYTPRLSLALSLNSEIFPDNKPGASLIGSGNLLLSNPDGKLDYLLNYNWNGRSITIKYANDYTIAYASFTTIFKGTVKELLLGESEISIVLRDSSEFLNKAIQTNVYAGSGGSAGTTDLKNVKKPLLWGRVYSAEPVLVDPVKLIYQFNDGVLTTVHGLFDKGVALTAGANYANYAALDAVDATTIPAGTYRTCTAEGYIRLGAPTDGLLTGDITGINQTSIADICNDIVINKGGLVSGDIDAAALAQFETDTAGESGYYLRTPESDIDQVIEELVGSVHGYWTINRAGKIVFGQFKFNTPAATIAAKDVASIKKEGSPLPNHQVEVSWRKVWAVHEDSDIAFIATLIPRGLYAGGTTYSEGDVVFLAGGAEYIYINATPSAGNTPPNVTYWVALTGQYTYPDGTPLVNLQPLEAGATNDANLDDATQLTINEKQTSLIPWDAANEIWYQALNARAAVLGLTAANTTCTTARTTWQTYRNGLSAAWNNVSAHTTIVRATYKAAKDAWDAALAALDQAISTENALRAAWSGVSSRPPLLTGPSLTVDDSFRDPTVWSNSNYSFLVDTAGEGYVQQSGTGVGQLTHLAANCIPVDFNATYEASWELWQDGAGAGTASCSTAVILFDSAGTAIAGDSALWFNPTLNTTLVTRGVWEKQSARFGKGTERPFPANAVKMGLGVFTNNSGLSVTTKARRAYVRPLNTYEMTSGVLRAWALGNGKAIRHIGVDANWGTSMAYSRASITGPQLFSWRWSGPESSGDKMAGLTESATPTIYTNAALGIYYRASANEVDIRLNGGGVAATYTGITTRNSDEFAIEYDGLYLYPVRNGVRMGYSLYVGTGKTYKAFVDSYYLNQGIIQGNHRSTNSVAVVGNNTYTEGGAAWLGQNYATSSDNKIFNADLANSGKGWKDVAGNSVVQGGGAGDPFPAFWRFPITVVSQVQINDGQLVPIEASKKLYVSGLSYKAGALVYFAVEIIYKRADGTNSTILASDAGSIQPATTSVWTPFLVTFVPPADAAYCILQFVGSSNSNLCYVGGTRLANTEPAADVTLTAQVTTIPPDDIIINADYLGAIIAGQFNKVLTPSVTRSGLSVRTDNRAGYTVTDITGGLVGYVTVNNTNGSADKGRVTVTDCTASGTFKLNISWDSVLIATHLIRFTVVPADPPSGGGGGGGTKSGTFSVSGLTLSGTTFVEKGRVSGLVKATGETIRTYLTSDYTLAHTSNLTRNMQAKWQYSIAGAESWTDFATHVSGSSCTYIADDFGSDTASITCNQTATPSNNTYDIRLVAAVNASSGTITFGLGVTASVAIAV